MLGRLRGLVVWGWLLSVWVQAYNFPPGFVHRYTYVSINNVMDHRNVTTVLKFEIQRLGEDASGRRSHTLRIDSYVQFMPGAQVLQNPGEWDLSKAFVFVSNPRGTIELVHCHPDDRKELLTVKKALAGVFSVHVQEEKEKDEWHYSTEETDHLGALKHDYTAKRTAKGLTLSRQHASVDIAQRFHDKTVHYDHQGILQSAVAQDRILVKDKTAGMSRIKSFPDEQPVESSSSGNFPDIEASSHVTVTYTGKRQTKQLDSKRQQQLLATLLVDSLETRHERTQTGLEKVQQNITKAWDCIHKNPEKDSENRSACVNELRSYLTNMKSQDYKGYVSKIFGNSCEDTDKECEDDRLILLDIVTRLGDSTSQELVVTHVLSKRPLVDEELRRVFIHCAAMEHPTKIFVAAVEKVCFGEDGKHLGTRTLGRTQGRACLAVGSLVKHLSASGQHQQADRLAQALESWLEQHGEGDTPITKRDTMKTHHAWISEEEEAEHLSKAVLLHSLGNGALERSKSHLLRHVVPNSGHHIWRRAALDALRHFNCQESARAMFNSVIHDEVFSVRRMALGVFASHPRRNDVTREEENDILSQNYTYTAVVRVKRDVFEKVLFQFKVELPKYEWSRELGNSKIGASFGVKFQNSIEGMFRVLSGYVDVDVHDKLWAEVHVGLLSLKADVLLIEACYRGRLSYNMNLIKDFTVDLMKDINSAFEHIVNKVMEPLGKFASSIASEYQNAATDKPKSGFQPLADAVKNLPTQTKSALQATEEFNEEADLLGALPVVKKLQALTTRAQSLMEDIHSEVSELFTNIADSAEVALPFAEKEIRSAVNSVLGALNKVKDYPNQAFSVIERGKMRYQLAMTRILQGSKIIKQVFSFLSGGKSSWNNAGEEVKSIVSQTKSLIAKIKADFSRRKRRATSNSADYTQCAKVELDDAMIRLYNKSEGMVTQLEIVLNHSPRELQRALDLMHTQTEILKASFAAFKEAIDIIKSRIQALFGVKFHPSFPNQRRDCDSRCGCGSFPTDCNRYGHPGVDLVWANRWRVPSPVTGMVHKNGSNAVRIKAQTTDLKEYEIIISNVEVHTNYTNQTEFFLEAGQVLGYSMGENGCNKGHIHLAMRRTSNQTGLCHYVDPSPFLDTFQPVPTWHQECKEFTFKHIGHVIDFGALTGGFKSLLTKLKRPALKWLKNQAIDKVKELIPDYSLLAPFKNLSLTFLHNINTDASNLKNLFTPGWDAAKGFFKNIKGVKLSFKGLLDMAAKSKLLQFKYPDLHQIINAAQKLVNIPKSLEQLRNRTVGALSRIWKRLKSAKFSFPSFQFGNSSLDLSLPSLNLLPGNSSLDFSHLGDLFDDLQQSVNGTRIKEFVSGAKEQLLSKLKTLLRTKLCPEVGKLLAKQGSPCIPHDDCMGLSCDVDIRRKHVTGRINVDVKVDRANRTVTITADGQEHTVAGSDAKVVPTGLKLFNAFDVQFKMGATWQGDDLQFSLTLQACGPNLCCLPDVVLAKNLSFSNFTFSDLRNILNNTDFDFELLPLDSSYKVSTDLNIDSPELTSSILGIKDVVRESLDIELPPDTQYRVEFKDPEEHSDDGKFPLTGQKTEIYFPFIQPIEIPFPLGIVTLWIRFSGGGVVGLAFNVHVQAVDSYMKATISPWVSARVEAGVSVSIFVFGLGLDLRGSIMQTHFPLSLETNCTKQPVVTTKQLDVELIPQELKLIAWVEIKIEIKLGWGIRITLFHKRWSKTIWHWRSSAIRGTVWKKISRKDDLGPPRFPYCDQVDQHCVTSGRRRRNIRAAPAVCMVKQLQGRHPKDAAFHLDFTVDDEDSDLDLSYAVGDYPGGTNVQSWTSMQGSVQFVPARFPCGKPLYFLVQAVNTQQLSTVAQCSLPTFDCTFPDGRVDLASKCTSQHSKLSAEVIVFDDSELKPDMLFSAVGYGPGAHGHEVADWAPLTLDNTQYQLGVSGNLRYFTLPRLGRLVASPLRTLKLESAAACGGECLKLVTCISFSFNQFLYACELQSVTEGVFAKRLTDGHYYMYERLGRGYNAEVEHRNLTLRHGVRYHVNSAVENVLGYQSVLTSPGIMVDHTPPEPGPVGEGAVEEMLLSGCSASIIQRCLEPVDLPDHRKIIDGKGAQTVFNGNRRGQDLVFTFENHHAAANWDGFKDGECGIHGYTWAVGTSVCSSDVSNFTDPHVTHPNPQDWTHLGLAKHLHLAEGPYFVTVQAVSDIELGGDLVTTVCHSAPFIIDITPPIMHSVSDVIFDDGFRFLAVYYNATDNLSGITRLEFGLGKTKYDVMIRKYLPFEIQGNKDNTHLLNKEFETASGVPAWIRLKVVDNVGLSATGHGGSPVLLDSTAPVAGDIMDGEKLGQDACCHDDNTSICVQWQHFEDPESHIESYWWGVGLSPGQDSVVAFHKLSSYDRHSCASGLSLEHNVTYFSTIIAYNKALNQKTVNASSNGVLIDVTPPVPGSVVDGGNLNQDLDFTSETASLTSSWSGFHDPESHMAFYTLSIFINGYLERNVTHLKQKQFTDHSFSLVHGDAVQVEVKATNKAGSSVAVMSDGLVVDHTPPDLVRLSTAAGTPFQQSDALLHFEWEFQDLESGLSEYRYVVHQLLHRTKTKFWPAGSVDHHSLKLSPTSSNSSQSLHLQGLTLTNGATYTLKVTAINGANMAAVEESSGVTVDTTPPVIEQVQISLPGGEEEVNEYGEVEHIKGESIHVSWKAHDFESSLSHVKLCIDLQGADCLMSNSTLSVETSSLQAFTVVLSDSGLQVSTDTNKVIYQVSLLVVNGAGVKSAVAFSKAIIVLRGNIAGVVLDGRSGHDEDFTNDKAAIAVTFFNFSSQACGIESYDWGVGSTPYATDILPYSDFGLVMDLNMVGSGKAQAHLMLMEGKTYYVTVRAQTGHACHEPYIVSCSDGITIDTTPPTMTFYRALDHSTASSTFVSSASFLQPLTPQGVVMQTAKDKLDVGWDVEDASGVNRTMLSLDTWGPNPQTLDVADSSMVPFALHSPVSPGDSVFSSLWAIDNAGNEIRKSVPTVMVDITPPTFDNLQCTEVVSVFSSLVTCSWKSVSERHSSLRVIEFGIGSGPSFPDLVNMTSVPLHKHYWTFDTAGLAASRLADYSVFYIIAKATNTAGLQAETSVQVRRDITPPDVSEVIIVTSPASVNSRAKQICQTSHDFVEIQLTGLADDESGVQSVEIALGTSMGTSDIHPFRPYTLVSGVYARGGLGLQIGSTVFATARVTNGVGLYRLVNSEGVTISPQPRLEVLDGPGMVDSDGQTDLTLIQGYWHFTDPCPIVSAEWWVMELGSGRTVHNLTAIPDSGQAFSDDTLSLDNLKTYVTHVRVVDASNRTFEAYSDGMTVSLDTPDTAAVWEGSGHHDMDYQESLQEIVASWEDFGNPRSALPLDHIIRYEVAVGTDREWSDTRSNIHSFEDVGLVNTYTFHGLNLTAKTVTYYITVRAYSSANIFAESSSDGIRAGYSGEIMAGRMLVDSHQSDVHSIRAAWDGFVSDMGELRYYIGVSTVKPPWDNSTQNCEAMLNSSFQYDVSSFQSIQAQSIIVLQGLSLHHNRTYYVTVIAEDLMLHCSAAVSGPILVDTTPPVLGDITAQGYDSDTAIFLHSSESLVVDLGAFPDEESGVETAVVQLFRSESCGMPSSQDVTVQAVTVQELQQITMRDVDLQEGRVYYLKVVVRNKAGLETKATSKPLLLNLSPPNPGVVKLGTNWTGGEQLFSGRTDIVEGVIALSSLDSNTSCVGQVDLMSAESRGLWKAAMQDFSADCSFVETSEMSVLVQHNAHLTGVDKGALQLLNLTLAEGNYTVQMKAASGEKVLTGISLASSSLHPPFLDQNEVLSQNQSADACDPVFGTCGKNNSDDKQLLAEDEYGFGISLAEVNGTSKVLFWAQDRIALKRTWVSLDVDPTVVFVDYMFGLKRLAEGAWEVTLLVNGVVKAAVSGLTFPGNMVVTIYTWNIDGYFPPVTDPLKPFRTVSRVTAVKMPLSPPPLCSYGSPFHDNNSGIKEVWVGVSSSFNQTADVAPFRLLKSFCMPCLLGCQNICSAACLNGSLSSGFQVLPLTLTNLSLEAASQIVKLNVSAASANSSGNSSIAGNASTSEVLNAFQLPMYYLDVKVVSQGGHVARAKSSALTFDLSPPSVQDVFCIDPSYASDEPVDYVGTNNSVGLKWYVSEDVSPMASQWVCIGTQSGLDDVVPWVEVDRLASKHVFSELNPSLAEGGTYHLSLQVLNAAGLSAMASVPFTVSTAPPDMSVMSPAPDRVTREMNVSGVSVAFTNSTNKVILNFNFQPTVNSSNNSLQLIEWSIGTQPGKDDIFPKSVVANRNVSKVAIIDGYMEIDGDGTNITMGDYADSNFQPSNGSDVSGMTFSMEPGRCLRQTVTGVSRSHTESVISGIKPVCIQRETDQLVLAGKSTLYVGVNKTTAADSAGSSPDDIKIQTSISRGGILLDALGADDLNAMYGTAASSQFSPYVVLPDPQDPTSRMLKKRVRSIPGPHFYLSPVADVGFDDDVDVLYNVSSSVLLPPGYIAIIMFWDAESKQWKAPKESCPSSVQSYNNQTQQIHTQVCLDVFVEVPAKSTPATGRRERSKRSVTYTPTTLTPRMFTVAVVGSTPINSPPTIQNVALVLLEDDLNSGITLSYTDDENDVLTFSILQQPMHGTVIVTSDGHVTYTPAGNYSGGDVIVLQGIEVLDAASVAAGMVPNVVNFSLAVSVLAVNDPPDVFYLTGSNNSYITPMLLVGPASGNGINVSVLVEGNTTSFVDLGLIVFGDVDFNDTLLYIDQASGDINATFDVTDSLQDPRLSGLGIAGRLSVVRVKAMSLRLGEGYQGRVSYNARVLDSAGAYSRQLTLTVHVMISPCIHGDCLATAPDQTCLDPQRAFTFDPFQCHCDPGYEGKWCEEEIDECQHAICSPITDCVDLINGYRCDPNPEKTAAIVICSILAVALIAAAIIKLRKRDTKKGIKNPAKSGNENMPDSLEKPSTAMNVSDLFLDEPPSSARSDSWSAGLMNMFPHQPMPNPARHIWRPMYIPNNTEDEAVRAARPHSRDSACQDGLFPASVNAKNREEVTTLRPPRNVPGKSLLASSTSRLSLFSARNSMMVPADVAREMTSTLHPPRQQAESQRRWPFPSHEQEASSYNSPSASNPLYTMEMTIDTQAEVYPPRPSGAHRHVLSRSDRVMQDELRMESWEREAVWGDGRRTQRARPPSVASCMSSDLGGFEELPYVGE